MINKLYFLDSIKRAFDVLSSDEPVDEKILDEALYYCMYPNQANTSTVLLCIKDYYSLTVADLSLEIQQKKICKKTVDLLDTLIDNGFRDLPNMIKRGYDEIFNILSFNCLPIERCMLVSRCHRQKSNILNEFDFDIYRLTKSVSKISEMSEISGYSTKIILLKWHFFNLINDIIEGILNKLNEVDIIDTTSFNYLYGNRYIYRFRDKIQVAPEKYTYTLSKIRSICLGEEPKAKKNVCEEDKKGLMRKYCKVYPSTETNLNNLIAILDDLKDSLSINQYMNKKQFSAIVYILYRSQGYIGMKPKIVKTYSKFKKLMCSYYDMQDNSYKENDIKELAMSTKERYLSLDKIKFDN